MNTAQPIHALETHPQLVVLTPPLQGHQVPLDNLRSTSECLDTAESNQIPQFQLDSSSNLEYLSHLLPSQHNDMLLTYTEGHWMISTAGKHLCVNQEPVYTAILEDGDIIQYGKLRCRFHATFQHTAHGTKSGTNKPTAKKRGRLVAISAALSLIAAATSYMVIN